MNNQEKTKSKTNTLPKTFFSLPWTNKTSKPIDQQLPKDCPIGARVGLLRNSSNFLQFWLQTERYNKERDDTERYNKEQDDTERYNKERDNTERYNKERDDTERYNKERDDTERGNSVTCHRQLG